MRPYAFFGLLLATFLSLVFTTLKLAGAIAWAWIWVLAPLWMWATWEVVCLAFILIFTWLALWSIKRGIEQAAKEDK